MKLVRINPMIKSFVTDLCLSKFKSSLRLGRPDHLRAVLGGISLIFTLCPRHSYKTLQNCCCLKFLDSFVTSIEMDQLQEYAKLVSDLPSYFFDHVDVDKQSFWSWSSQCFDQAVID
jgi:hypothetical protein